MTGGFIPFLAEFAEAVRSGRKTMTCRPRRYGVAGTVIGSTFGAIRLLEVERMALGYVAEACYVLEGCDSREAFVEVWERLHPRSGFDPERLVWAHTFVFLGTEP